MLESPSRALLTATDHLLYVQDGMLFARPFDERSLRLVGEPQPIATRVAGNPGIGSAGFSVAERGALVYTEGGSLRPELIIKDRRGAVVGRLSEPGRYLGPALDASGRRMVVEIGDAESGQHSLWIFDTPRGTRSQLTRAPHDGHHPVWSPDGREMAFTSSRTGKWLAYRQRTDGLGEDTLLFDAPDLLSLYPRVWATDGRGILAAAQEKDGRRRLWWLPARRGEAARPLVESRAGKAKGCLGYKATSRNSIHC